MERQVKWEYTMQHSTTMSKPIMDELGMDGWELVCYIPEEQNFYFKRPIYGETDN